MFDAVSGEIDGFFIVNPSVCTLNMKEYKTEYKQIDLKSDSYLFTERL